MNREAYQIGMLLALRQVGFQKTAGISSILLHPATLFAGLGGLGTGLAAGRTNKPIAESALRGAAAGALLGAGMRYLPELIRKTRALKPLHPYATDLGWVAPSLVAAPIIFT